ncbi:hypothetical protein SAV31267_005950 [Streptomyces avermitilis]|uniref:Uncharacterized protein n=1 Tax=Streptomyces avermitilis TaxID=33903 RepID=A0A4D4MGI1_STRAX|nr:hypothetical protein SAV31267_005950 [Streptomyces avermitilis]
MRTWDLCHPRQYRHRGDPDGQPEDRHADRQRGGDERTERQEQDRGRGEEADQLARAAVGVGEDVEEVPAHLDAQRQLGAQPVAEIDEGVEVFGRQPALIGVLHPDDRDPPVGRNEAPAHGGVPARVERPHRVARAEHVRQPLHLGLQPRESGARAVVVEERRSAVEGVTTTWAVIPSWPVPARSISSAARWESSPGAVIESAVRPPKATAARTASVAATSHAAITRQGWRAALAPRRNRAFESIGSSNHLGGRPSTAADAEARRHGAPRHRPAGRGSVGPGVE